MPRPTIDYLNARRALKPASGETNYRAREQAVYAPEGEQIRKRPHFSFEKLERNWQKVEKEQAQIATQIQKVIEQSANKELWESLSAFTRESLREFWRTSVTLIPSEAPLEFSPKLLPEFLFEAGVAAGRIRQINERGGTNGAGFRLRPVQIS
jgi:hypothetical protein